MNTHKGGGLAVIETHPIQYHAPIYRVLQQNLGIPVAAIYGSNFSIAGYRDLEFGETFAWDTDLLSGYTSMFLSRVSDGGADSPGRVSTRGLKDVLQSLAPKAVLVVGYSPRFHQMAFYQAWMARYPILFRGETTDHARQRRWAYATGRDQMLRFLYHRCNRLLYVGCRSYEHFQRLGCPDEKLVFSPYCVDASAFDCDEAARARLRPLARACLGITERQTILLFSGKLSPRKGPDLLLRALKALPSELRTALVVLFMGNGEMRNVLENLAQEPPSLKVHFLGFQNQTCLSSYYHAADLMVLPSVHSEPWGLVVNEALHHGLPCVASDAVGSVPDLVEPGTTGEIFKTASVGELGLAIQRALCLTGFGSVREKCREKVGGYSVEKAAEGIAKAYRDVLASDPCAASWR